MSAPDTNLKKQGRRHRGPLIGIAVALTVGSLLLLWLIVRVFSDAPGPNGEQAPTPPAAATSSSGMPAEGTVVDEPADTGTPSIIEQGPAPAD